MGARGCASQGPSGTHPAVWTLRPVGWICLLIVHPFWIVCMHIVRPFCIHLPHVLSVVKVWTRTGGPVWWKGDELEVRRASGRERKWELPAFSAPVANTLFQHAHTAMACTRTQQWHARAADTYRQGPCVEEAAVRTGLGCSNHPRRPCSSPCSGTEMRPPNHGIAVCEPLR